MANQDDQKNLLDALDKQSDSHRKVNRILKVVLPITAFLIAMICANLNWQSTLGTFVMLTIAFLAVGIKRWSVFIWLALVAIYCVLDNYFSYHTLALKPLKMQMGTMLAFTIIVHMSRPYLDRLMTLNSNK
ncbi:MAG: hypothetical protein QM666_00485 [Acinetobacter sp.]